MSDDIIMGDVYIGTGETDGVRLIARAAQSLQSRHPGIHYHISSGNAVYVSEYLDKGLIDFGVVFGDVDLKKYSALETSYSETWGVLMRKDSVLADRENDFTGRSPGQASDSFPAGIPPAEALLSG